MRQLIEVKWDAKTQNKKARRGTRTLPAGGQVGTSGEDGSPTAAALEVGRASHRSDELRRVTRVGWAAVGLWSLHTVSALPCYLTVQSLVDTRRMHGHPVCH